MVARKGLSRPEQIIARGFNTPWIIVDTMLRPDSPFTHEGGGSHSTVPGHEGESFWYNRIGLSFGSRAGKDFALRWNRLKAHAFTLSPDLIARLRANQRERNEHIRSYRMFTAPAEAVGCGPIPGMGPLTRVHQMYVDAHAQWVDEMLTPYHALAEMYREDMASLLDEAFPLASGLCVCSALTLAHLPQDGCEVAA